MKLSGFLLIIIQLFIPLTQGCRLWMCEAPEHNALLFYSDGTGIVYPDVVKDRATTCRSNTKEEDHFEAIDIPEGESVIAACPGEKFKNSWVDLPKNKLKNYRRTSLTLTCRNDRLVNNRDSDMDWSDLGCIRKLYPTLQISGKRCGGQQGQIITIGWPIDNNMFIPQIEICFDKELETTLYEHHLIQGRYLDANEKNERPSFKEGGVAFSANINNLYKKDNQTVVLAKILGTPDHLEGFGTGEKFFSRGHLAPDADFVMEEEQDATYYFVNVVPQWQSSNNGNWKILEGATRKLAEDKEQTLNIWTGTHGILHLPDDQGNNVPVYFGQSVNLNILPVPELMWKVVYNPVENKSVVFIGLNDIRGSSVNNFNILCQNVCSKIKWLEFSTEDKKGDMICCTVHDAKRIITTLPELDGTHLLRG